MWNWAVKLIALSIKEYIAALTEKAEDDGYTDGLKEGKKQGYARGYDAGNGKGYITGYSEGYRDGFAKGETVWRISDEREPSAPLPVDVSVYGPERFKVSPELASKMRADVSAAVEKGIVTAPTDDQWAMILSDHPATCVAAGAGSGKSTTLVLRVVFMAAYLNIPLDRITVVSFTRATVRELREKLLKVFEAWNYPFSKAQAKSLVRTFHSALYSMARAAFPGYTFFEVTNEDDEDVENPLASSKLNNAQLDLLKDAYTQLYATDTSFKRHVLAIMTIEADRESTLEGKEYENYVLASASRRDRDLVERTNSRWQAKGLWPIQGVDPEPAEFRAVGHVFWANGRVRSSGRLVFLGPLGRREALFRTGEKVGEDRAIDIFQALQVKRNIVGRYCETEIAYLPTRRSVDRLALRIQLDEEKEPRSAPRFDVRLSGELKPAELTEAFWAQGSFIESLGVEVSSATARMSFREEGLEHHFAAALNRFWIHFERTLNGKKVMTFNRAFLLLSKSEVLKKLPFSVFEHLTHALIDEFQDISPQIAKWLLESQRRIAVAHGQPSIMGIGDDWQSVYAWRGSAPDFFINFHKRFPVHQLAQPGQICRLDTNFRSVAPVVERAGTLLDFVENKYPKKAVAHAPGTPGEKGVYLSEGSIDERISKICDDVRTALNEVRQSTKRDPTEVIFLCRSNDLLRSFEKELADQDGIRFYTFHGAKGLQGEVAFVIGDMEPGQPHPFRSRVYALSGHFSQTYEEAMSDEAYRLAYVALTRGKRRVHWYVDEARHAAKAFRSVFAV